MNRFIAVDWGTTNRRIYVIDGGKVVSTERDAKGILSVEAGEYEKEIAAIRARYGDLRMLLAGMVGSNRGWVEAGYVPTPATIEKLAAALVRPLPGVAIVPGVSDRTDRRGDVMRGEEVQLLGAAAAQLVPEAALLCQPGTHCKWAHIDDGAIHAFTTAMTGELFGLLKAHSLIGSEMAGEVAPGDAFLEGVEEARRGDMLGSLFGVRAASLLNLRPPHAAASFVSGLLIGADVGAHVNHGSIVYLLADAELAALYGAAIMAMGAQPHVVDSHAAFVAGISRISELST